MPATAMFSSRASFTGLSLPLRLVVTGVPGGLGRVRQDGSAEAREPGEVSSDLRGLDAPRIVTHDAEAVIQRHGGAVYARESLQSEPRRCGTAPARHLGDVKPNHGRVRSLRSDLH